MSDVQIGRAIHGISGMERKMEIYNLDKDDLREKEMVAVMNIDAMVQNLKAMMDPKVNYQLGKLAVSTTKRTKRRRRNSWERCQHRIPQFFELVKERTIGIGSDQSVFGFMEKVNSCLRVWWDHG